MIAGSIDPIYKFDHGVLGVGDVEYGVNQISIDGKVVDLNLTSPYEDMLSDKDYGLGQ